MYLNTNPFYNLACLKWGWITRFSYELQMLNWIGPKKNEICFTVQFCHFSCHRNKQGCKVKKLTVLNHLFDFFIYLLRPLIPILHSWVVALILHSFFSFCKLIPFSFSFCSFSFFVSDYFKIIFLISSNHLLFALFSCCLLLRLFFILSLISYFSLSSVSVFSYLILSVPSFLCFFIHLLCCRPFPFCSFLLTFSCNWLTEMIWNDKLYLLAETGRGNEREVICPI